jgi:hypothetical protein
VVLLQFSYAQCVAPAEPVMCTISLDELRGAGVPPHVPCIGVLGMARCAGSGSCWVWPLPRWRLPTMTCTANQPCALNRPVLCKCLFFLFLSVTTWSLPKIRLDFSQFLAVGQSTHCLFFSRTCFARVSLRERRSLQLDDRPEGATPRLLINTLSKIS